MCIIPELLQKQLTITKMSKFLIQTFETLKKFFAYTKPFYMQRFLFLLVLKIIRAMILPSYSSSCCYPPVLTQSCSSLIIVIKYDIPVCMVALMLSFLMASTI